MTVHWLPSPLQKLWHLLSTRVLTLKRFDLFLQGSLLILVLLDSNVTLLLKRDAARGHVPGNIHDWVAVGAAVLEFVLGALIAWWGQARKNLALSVWLAAAAAAGLLVLAFPYEDSIELPVELCSGEEVSALTIPHRDPLATPRIVMLVITAGFCALGRLSVLAHGLTYLDDHEPENGAYFYGILISIRLSLGLNGVSWLTPGSTRSDWWQAQLSISMLTLMFAALFTLFPSRMEKYKLVDDEMIDRGILIYIRLSLGLNGVSWLTPGSTRSDWWQAQLSIAMLTLMFAALFTRFPSCMEKYKLVDDEMTDRGFLVTLGRVVRNKTVLVQSAALSFLYAAVFSFIRYDGDFVQAQFHIESVRQDPRASRAITDIFRSLVIIFFVSIFRTRFSVRRADGVKGSTAARVGGVVAFMVALPFVVIAVLRCGAGDVAVGAGGGDGYFQPACSLQCGCQSENYGFSPVCELQTSTTYFSPCHAGCSSYEDLNGFLLFSECSCGGGRAARGPCTLPGCLTVFNVYQIMFAVVLAFAGASLLMQGMVLLRAVLIADKAVAVGASFATIALLSHVPGYILYMIISHVTCAYSHNGACLLHNPSLWSMAALSAGLSVVSGVLSLVASRL